MRRQGMLHSLGPDIDVKLGDRQDDPLSPVP